MADTVFRTKIESTKVEEKPQVTSQQAKPVVDVEPPYLDYTKVNTKPFVADYFQLGDIWDDPLGGFPKEVSTIENYFQHKIQTGEIANSQSAVKNEIKKILKMNNLSQEERPLVKIETLAAYIQFLMKTEDIKYQLRRKYATNT